MIESWRHQSCPIPLYISVSVDEKFTDVFNCMMKIWDGDDYENLYICIPHKKTSQFANYKILANNLPIIDDETWVIFTDDDDIWHKDRALVYKNAIVNDEEILYMWAQRHCMNNSATFDEKPIELITNDKYGEYINYSCKMKTLRDFCNRASDFVMDSYLADMMFVKYLRLNNNKQIAEITIEDETNWMYYYRCAENTNRNCVQNNYYIDKLQLITEFAKNYKNAIYAYANNISLFALRFTREKFDSFTEDDLYEQFCEYIATMKDMLVADVKDKLAPRGIFTDIMTCGIIDGIVDSPLAN